MSLYFSSLNSGSNGNCYYIGNSSDAVLVDVGLSCKEIEKRFRIQGLHLSAVKAIFISHEHSDHIKGLCVLAQKYALPVYGNKNTLAACGDLNPELVHHISADEIVAIGSLQITAFSKFHDAADPLSFTITDGRVTIGVFTDIGRVCKNLIHHFSKCQAIFLEANYDEVMLEQGRYPFFLKNRIRGGRGHLSNKEALEVFIKYRHKQLQHLLLSHLSKDNNCPDRALEMFLPYAGKTRISIASRYEASEVFFVGKGREISLLPKKSTVQQLSFF